MSLTKPKYNNKHALNLFQEIAKCLPDLKLSTVLEAEEKFHLADGNKDGVSTILILKIRKLKSVGGGSIGSRRGGNR